MIQKKRMKERIEPGPREVLQSSNLVTLGKRRNRREETEDEVCLTR